MIRFVIGLICGALIVAFFTRGIIWLVIKRVRHPKLIKSEPYDLARYEEFRKTHLPDNEWGFNKWLNGQLFEQDRLIKNLRAAIKEHVMARRDLMTERDRARERVVELASSFEVAERAIERMAKAGCPERWEISKKTLQRLSLPVAILNERDRKTERLAWIAAKDFVKQRRYYEEDIPGSLAYMTRMRLAQEFENQAKALRSLGQARKQVKP